MPQYKYNTKKGVRWTSKFNYCRPGSDRIETEYKRGFMTRRDAKKYEDAFLEDLEKPESRSVHTIADIYNEYLASYKRSDLKQSTLQTKRNIFQNHIAPYFNDIPVENITSSDIANWQDTMSQRVKSDGTPFSQTFLRTIQSQFNALINYAKDKGYIALNPLVDIKNMGYKGKRLTFWSYEEYEKFAYEAMNFPEYYYAYEVLYWCGVREGELLALTREDVDLCNRTLRVSKTYSRIGGEDIITTPKTQSSIRTISIPQFLCDELAEYFAMQLEMTADQRIFRFTKHGLFTNFQSVISKAGVKKIPIHGLRHSHVSLLISKQYDIFEVSKRIGHKSISTTQDIYGHLFDSVQKAIAKDLDDMRSGR